MTGPDIFISYSREERPAAKHFAECLAAEGFSVWWDAALRSGQTFDEVIEHKLRSSKAVVVLWSPRSVSSRWVRAEATLADRGNKLVPVIIEPCTLPIIFELTQAADLSSWSGDTEDPHWKALVSDIRGMVGGDAAEPLPVSRAEPVIEPAPVARPAPVHDLSKPTREEEQVTQFFKRSDEYRFAEGDRFHCLQRLHSDLPEARYVVHPAGLTIGRSAPADIIVGGSAVSRAHCRVDLAGDKLRVTDLNSTNGTFIDDQRVNGSALLPVGSVLRVGNVTFEHEIGPPSPMGEGVDLVSFSHERRRAGGLAKN